MMWESVELRDLRLFLALSDELHYGRAAARVGITASRASQSVRALETKLGGKLFDRTSRRVALTPLGERFRDAVAPAYEQLQRAWMDTSETAAGTVRALLIGMYARSTSGRRLTEIVKLFHDRHPACPVELIETGMDRDQVDWLQRGGVDMLAVRLPFSHSDVIVGPVLSTETRVLLVARDHPLAERDEVRYDDISPFSVADGTLPREMLDAFIPPRTPSGRRLRRVPVHGLGEVLMRVAIGEIVHPTVESFLEYYPDPGVKAIPITDLPESKSALVWLATNNDSRVKAFAQAAADVMAD